MQLLSRLNESCISVSIPNFHWAVFWPFNVHDPRNNPDDKLYPYGKYPYGNLIILNMLKAGLNSEQIFAQYMELDLNSVFNLSEVLTNTLTRAYADDCRLDVKVTPFIQQNFRSRRLFATINHPSFEVILEVANQVLPLVGIARLPADAVNGLPQWGGHILPIHPSITKFFKLEYESACANCLRYDKGYSQSDYIRGYIDFL